MATGLTKSNTVIGLEEGWKLIHESAIQKLQEFIDNGIKKRQQKLFQHNAYMTVYTYEALIILVSLEHALLRGFGQRGHGFLFTNCYFRDCRKCYDMCTQRAPYNWSEALYERHGQCIEDYLQKTVLPAFDTVHNGLLLSELVKRWDNHKIMNDWLEKFFRYLVCGTGQSARIMLCSKYCRSMLLRRFECVISWAHTCIYN